LSEQALSARKRTPPFTAIRTFLITSIMAFATLLTAGAAHAVDDGTLGIRPEKESDFFHLSVYPGSALDATAIVSNHTGSPVTLKTYPVDGQSSPQGTFALAAESDARKGVGAWVELKADSVTVPAKSELKVPFRISVPAGTEPGDYAGGLIIEAPPVKGETAVVDGDKAVRLDVIQRQGVRIYLNVAGEAMKSMDHGALAWQRDGDSVRFSLPVQNTGNVTLHPTAELEVKDWAGDIKKLSFNKPESVLPGETVELHATLKDAPPVHMGTAQADFSSEAGSGRAETTIVYVSTLVTAISLLVLVLATLAIWRIVRFVRRARHAMAQIAQAGTPIPESRREAKIRL
jgi:hypothetical protein